MESPEEALDFIQSKPSPLSVYLFSSDRKLRSLVRSKIRAGALVENDALIQAGLELTLGSRKSSG